MQRTTYSVSAMITGYLTIQELLLGCAFETSTGIQHIICSSEILSLAALSARAV